MAPCSDELAVGDDDDVVDGLLHLREHVARDQDRLALAAQVAQEHPQPPDALGVEAVGRFVEQEHLGVAEQCGRQAEALAHAHGVAAGPLSGSSGDADHLEHLVDPLAVDTGGVGHDPQVVAPGAARMEVGGLQRRPDDALRRPYLAVRLAADRRAAAGRPDQAQQHPQRGGLAGSVGPQEAGDPAGLDGEAEVVDRGEGAELLGQVAHFDTCPMRRGISHVVSQAFSCSHPITSTSREHDGRGRVSAISQP